MRRTVRNVYVFRRHRGFVASVVTKRIAICPMIEGPTIKPKLAWSYFNYHNYDLVKEAEYCGLRSAALYLSFRVTARLSSSTGPRGAQPILWCTCFFAPIFLDGSIHFNLLWFAHWFLSFLGHSDKNGFLAHFGTILRNGDIPPMCGVRGRRHGVICINLEVHKP